MVTRVAASFDTPDREDLEAELAWRLLVFKRRPPPLIRNRKAYTFTFLRNRARDWIKAYRKARGKVISFDRPFVDDDESAAAPGEALNASDQDLPLALSMVWDELPSHLRELWKLRTEEGLNLSEAAKRIGKHRNTIRNWTRRIWRILESHGVEGSGTSHNWLTPRPEPAAKESSKPCTAKRRDFRALETRRRQAVSLVLQGVNQSEVSRRLRVARQTVCRWVSRYRKSGDLGLVATGRVGRPPLLTNKQEQELGRLMRGASSGAPTWTLRQVVQVIEDHFGVHYHVGHVWRLVRRLTQ